MNVNQKAELLDSLEKSLKEKLGRLPNETDVALGMHMAYGIVLEFITQGQHNAVDMLKLLTDEFETKVIH